MLLESRTIRTKCMCLVLSSITLSRMHFSIKDTSICYIVYKLSYGKGRIHTYVRILEASEQRWKSLLVCENWKQLFNPWRPVVCFWLILLFQKEWLDVKGLKLQQQQQWEYSWRETVLKMQQATNGTERVKSCPLASWSPWLYCTFVDI